jgi:hypothetical protein
MRYSRDVEKRRQMANRVQTLDAKLRVLLHRECSNFSVDHKGEDGRATTSLRRHTYIKNLSLEIVVLN